MMAWLRPCSTASATIEASLPWAPWRGYSDPVQPTEQTTQRCRYRPPGIEIAACTSVAIQTSLLNPLHILHIHNHSILTYILRLLARTWLRSCLSLPVCACVRVRVCAGVCVSRLYSSKWIRMEMGKCLKCLKPMKPMRAPAAPAAPAAPGCLYPPRHATARRRGCILHDADAAPLFRMMPQQICSIIAGRFRWRSLPT